MEMPRCSFKVLELSCEEEMEDSCDGYNNSSCPSYTTMKHLEGYHLIFDIGKSIEQVVHDLETWRRFKCPKQQ